MEARTMHFLCFVTSVFACVLGFNIDTEFPVVFKGPTNGSFGLAVQFLANNKESLALVTAPTADYKRSSKDRKTGVLYKCNISTTDCQEFLLDDIRDTEGRDAYNEKYKELKRDMFLGISLDIQSIRNGAVVACGHKWKNVFQEMYFLNGVCYVIDNNLDTGTSKKLLPLTKIDLQVKSDPTIYHYYLLGMAGFSAAFTEDGTHLLLGAPGISELTGSVIDYRMEPNMAKQIPYVVNPNEVIEEHLMENSLIGYSVSSGVFFENGKVSYVAGAPRAENDNGCVYIFEQFPHNSRSGIPVIQEKLVGEKMGEYFGSVVLGINLNNDKYTDLLISSPFHSTSSTYDSGRVYVYISDGTAFRKQDEKLEGSRKSYARFGTAISAAGDLNQDGYIDLAIGAPYEDGVGAVYIYHATANGVNADYAQRISPEQLKVDLTGFGYGIGKGIDIDSNSYPDLLIGAYSSDKAVLLRSLPLISIHAQMKFNMNQIKFNSSDCEINGTKETCFDVSYCLKYSGKFVPDSVDMMVSLEADVQKFIQPRIYFMEEATMGKKSEIKFDLTLHKDTLNCSTRKAYVKRDVEDFISPIPFIMTYDAKKSLKHFCSTCPVLDKSIPNRLMQQIMFWTGCGDNNECLSDLKMQVSLVGLRNKEIVIGEKKPLIMDVTTTNEGEPAFQCVVHVCIPHNIDIINKAECLIDYDDTMNVCLKCNVGNPLPSGQSESFQLKLDTTKLARNLTELEIEFMVNTTSNDTNPSDNNITVTIPIVSKAGVHLIGSTDSEIVFLKDEMPEKIPIVHKYTVAKFMPSPVSSINVKLSIPVKSATDYQTFLNISDIHIDEKKASKIIRQCNSDVQHKESPHFENIHGKDPSGNRYVSSEHPDHSGFDTAIVDCSTAICHTVCYVVGPFIHQEAVTFQIAGFINLTVLQNVVGKRDITVLISEGIAEIVDENIKLDSLKKSDFTVVTTSFEKHDLHKRGKIVWWIIIVSVIGGFILLALLIFTLVKLGFFRRKQMEEMDKLTETDHLLNRDNPPQTGPEGTSNDDR